MNVVLSVHLSIVSGEVGHCLVRACIHAIGLLFLVLGCALSVLEEEVARVSIACVLMNLRQILAQQWQLLLLLVLTIHRLVL